MNFKLQLLGRLALLLFSLLFGRQAGAQTGALRGAVFDPSGAVVPGAQIALSGAGKTVQTKSGADGRYAFRALASGAYAISVTAKGFAPLTLQNIQIEAGQAQELNLPLVIATERQEVTVGGQNREVGINPEQNSSATVLSGSALSALSDDPDELKNELQALAGPAAGPNGGQIYIDGFAGSQLPPKSSILEIRVNQNPFSAEFDRLGYGRVEIITKPGAQKFQGSLAGGGTDSVLNTANPLVPGQPSYYQYSILGNVSGPMGRHASYFFSGFRVDHQNQAIVDALNPQDTNASVLEAHPDPITYLSINPRFDFQLGANTVTISDSFYRTHQTGSGVGTLNLPSQASTVISEENALQLSDAILVNSHFVNETHFQWSRIYNDQVAANLTPTVTVQGAFTSGGNGTGVARDAQDNFELQNYSTASAGAHALRFGMRLRLYDDSSYSTTSQNGTYTFNTVAAYQAGTPELYSQTIINNPLAQVLLFDGSFFIQDDWHWKPNFVLGAGLRLEGQNRIHDHADWAPRLAFAWSPGRMSDSTRPKTVIRAGYGWFFNRFTVPNFFSANSGTPYVIDTIHHNRINELGYVIENPDFFDPAAPEPASVLSSTPSSFPTFQTIDPHFHAALDMQTGAGVDRQLVKGVTVNLTYLYTQGVHQYLSNNVNAPAFDASTYTITGPFPSIDDYQFQSGGVYRQNQLIFTSSLQLKHLVFNGTYMLNEAKSDTQGAYYVPSAPHDPGLDYGRAGFGFKQRLIFIESYSGPFGIAFSSLLVAQSGTPYNLTIGDDATGSNQFNARPTYGNCNEANVISTQYGCLDIDPTGKSERMVPYGVGIGPANAVYHVRLSKVIGVGPRTTTAAASAPYEEGSSSVSGRGLSGGGAAIHLDQAAPRRDNLTLAVVAANLFNEVNLGTPNGVLLSPLFNKTQSLAPGAFGSSTPGNRAISFQATFSF